MNGQLGYLHFFLTGPGQKVARLVLPPVDAPSLPVFPPCWCSLPLVLPPPVLPPCWCSLPAGAPSLLVLFGHQGPGVLRLSVRLYHSRRAQQGSGLSHLGHSFLAHSFLALS